MWSLVTLGSLRLVDVRSEADCLPGRRKELVLLAFLARRAPRMVPRAVLAELLWGDKDEDRARASLRQALSQLRRVLGDALDVQTDTVALSSSAVALDLKKLEDTAASGHWNAVVAQWTGSFLAGHDDVGTESFREWIDGERAHLARIMERAFAALIEDAERRGAVNDALATARRWHDAFPDDESAADALTRTLNAMPERGPDAQDQAIPPLAGAAPQTLPATITKRPWLAARRSRWLALGGGLILMLAAAVPLARQSFFRTGVGGSDGIETVIVPDLRTVGVDTVLAQVVSEALRIDLRQSRALIVYPPAAVQQGLKSVGTPDAASADLEMIRRVAARAGAKAVVDGEILASGSQYLVSVRLVATTSGAELKHYSVRADDRDQLLSAIDGLALKLRRGAGETLGGVEDARPVERVTTTSLEALSRYVRATRALDFEGATEKGVALLDEAIALDSTFAMAYRRLAIELNDRGGNDARLRRAVEHAYAFRARLTDPERHVVEAAYFAMGPMPDEDKAIAAYEAALEANPRFGVPYINLSGIALRRHQFARAESLAQRALMLGSASAAAHANLAQAQTNQGKLDAAAATIAHLDSVSPGNNTALLARARWLNARGATDSAAIVVEQAFNATTDIGRRQLTAGMMRDLALAQGNVAEGRRWAAIWTDAAVRRNQPGAALTGALDQAWITLWFEHDTSAALREVASALQRNPLGVITPLDRPYGKLIRLFAWAGRPSRARVALAGYDSATGGRPRLRARALTPRYEGEIALAERRYGDALANFRAADSLDCVTCLLPFMAITYDRMGTPDSARILWRRYLETPDYEDRIGSDASFRRMALQELPFADEARVKRLEARGKR